MHNRHQKRGKNPHALRNWIILIAVILVVVLFGRLVLKGFSLVPVALQYITRKDITLKKTQDNRVNILLLGIGGGTHDGPNLTDTIIFASIDPQKQTTTLVSIPRDLWVSDLHSKVNKIYSDGEDKRQGGGLILTKAMVGKLLGQHIDYGFRIDFTGFERAVDEVGGLEIDVTRSFDDYAYPLSGKEDDSCGKSDIEIASASAQIATSSATESDEFPCRYEHLHFDKGTQHMDGTTALKYVRSRHALGPEGSDFARSQRQQKVIAAFKEKIFSLGTILNPVKVANLIDVLQSSIDTDITSDEYDDFIKLAQKMQNGKINSTVIDTGNEEIDDAGLLIHPPIGPAYENAWVLIPSAGNGDYSQIQLFVTCKVTGKNCPITPTPIR